MVERLNVSVILSPPQPQSSVVGRGLGLGFSEIKGENAGGSTPGQPPMRPRARVKISHRLLSPPCSNDRGSRVIPPSKGNHEQRRANAGGTTLSAQSGLRAGGTLHAGSIPAGGSRPGSGRGPDGRASLFHPTPLSPALGMDSNGFGNSDGECRPGVHGFHEFGARSVSTYGETVDPPAISCRRSRTSKGAFLFVDAPFFINPATSS